MRRKRAKRRPKMAKRRPNRAKRRAKMAKRRPKRAKRRPQEGQEEPLDASCSALLKTLAMRCPEQDQKGQKSKNLSRSRCVLMHALWPYRGSFWGFLRVRGKSLA